MASVFILREIDRYSDDMILAVFSTKELADYAKIIFLNSGPDRDAWIEELPLDPESRLQF